jgi:hypothetical protein
MGVKVHRLAWTSKRAPADQQTSRPADQQTRAVYLPCKESALFQRIADTLASSMKARGSVRCWQVRRSDTHHPSPTTAPLPRAI